MERLQAWGVGVCVWGAGALESRLPKWAPLLERGLGPGLLFSPGVGPREDPRGPRAFVLEPHGLLPHANLPGLRAGCFVPSLPFPGSRRARTCLGNSPRPGGSGRAGVAPCAQALSSPPHPSTSLSVITCPSFFPSTHYPPSHPPSSCFSMLMRPSSDSSFRRPSSCLLIHSPVHSSSHLSVHILCHLSSRLYPSDRPPLPSSFGVPPNPTAALDTAG